MVSPFDVCVCLRYEANELLLSALHCISCVGGRCFAPPAIAQIALGSTRLNTFGMSSPCILAVSTLSNSTARLARQRQARLAT